MVDRYLIVLDAEGVWRVVAPDNPLPPNPSAFVVARCTRLLAEIHALDLNDLAYDGTSEELGRKLALIRH